MSFLAIDEALAAGKFLLSIALRRKRSDKDREATRRWAKANPEKTRAYYKSYRERRKISGRPKPPISEKQKQYQATWMKNNPEKMAEYRRKWISKTGRQYMRDYEKRKRATDLNFRIAKSLRLRTRQALKGLEKSEKTLTLLGCTVQSFRLYLESLFLKGMTWENYGSFWEIDHIIPCAIFDMSNPDHQRRCFHFSNQRPLTVTANRRKHTKTTAVIC